INSNTGTLSGDTAWTNGKFGKALSFDGSGDYISIANMQLSETENGTIAFYAKFAAAGGVETVFDSSSFASAVEMDNSGATYFWIYTDSASGNWGRAWNVNQWYYILVTKTGTTWELFIDDNSLGTKSISGNFQFDRIASANSALEYFNGDIDEVKIYNRALSAREISESYRQKAPSMAQGGTISDSSAYTALTIQQNGAGDIVNFKDGDTSIFSIIDGGNISVGTATGFSDTPVKLSDPASLPAGAAYASSFSPDGTYLAVPHAGLPYIAIYKRSGDTFTKLSDPAILPTNTGVGASFSPDGTYLAVAHSFSPYLTIYKRSGDTFTKLSDPAILPTNTGVGASFSPDGTYLAVAHATSPYLTMYKRSGDTFT
ncbi:MAG: hypothetical protein KAS78_04135, partial [Candidatus Pacebacteria bacterium]|nr:hypothetical protein [Candidatus Paceibacterota bacterium]